MVLQGNIDEAKIRADPSGGKEAAEDFEARYLRRVYEETGYLIKIIKEIIIDIMKLWRFITLKRPWLSQMNSFMTLHENQRRKLPEYH